MRCTAIIAFLLAAPAIAQNNPHEVIKTVDDYCAAISKQVDAMDDTEEDTLLSDLAEPDRAKVVEYLKSLHDLRGVIRHDACDAKDLKSARVATRRDLKKHAALTDEMLAYAHKAMAEAYRKKTQSEKNSK
jgi:hypothetical protein